MRLYALMLEGTSALEHLALESVLSAGEGPFEPLLIFYINDPCIVIGRNQNPWREVSPFCELPVFRRVSGGGAVYHDNGNLNWAFIVPRSAHDREAELDSIAGAIGGRGLPVATNERGGVFAGDRKISGSARRFGLERVLHHGTLLVHADLSALRATLGGVPTFEDASLPSEPSPVVNVANFAPGMSVHDWAVCIAKDAALSPLSSARASDLVNPGLLAKEMAVLKSDDWIYGRTPAFTISGEPRATGAIRIEGGRVASGVGSREIGRYFTYGDIEKTLIRSGAIPAGEEVRA